MKFTSIILTQTTHDGRKDNNMKIRVKFFNLLLTVCLVTWLLPSTTVLATMNVNVSYDLNGVVSSNTADTIELGTGIEYTTTLSLEDGMYTYLLPASIQVYINGSEAEADVDYTYDSTTGELAIPNDKVTGDIKITAAAEAMTVTAPTVTAVTGDGSDYSSCEWSTDSITYTVSGSTTTAPRGIYNYQYSTNGTSWITISLDENGVGTLKYSTSGNYTLQFRACARVSTTGNGTTSIYSEATSFSYMIDNYDPTISATATDTTSGYLQSKAVTISAWACVSQAESIKVSKDGGEYEDITSDFTTTQNNVRSYSYAGTYTVTESGTYTFCITNGAGVSATVSITCDNIDSAKPVVVLDTGDYIHDSATTEDVTVTLSNATANLGTTTYKYSADFGTTWESLDTIDGKATLTLSDAGYYELMFIAVSESGVESETANITVIIEQVCTWEIPVEVTVEQGGSVAPPVQDFALEIVGLDGETVDLDAIGAAVELSSDVVATDGAGSYTATLTFTGAGDARTALSDGFILRLVQGDAAGWTCDDAEYDVICWFGDDGAQTESSIADTDGNTCDTVSFTCTYTGWALFFETNGGSGIDAVSAADGTAVDLADYVPSKDGYTFAGWYSDEALSQAVESVTMTADATVYANWQETVENDPADEPTTEAPTTEAPTTEAPTTEAPTT
ncbi:MAG: InlB B-repeat-containing protein, partial [Clostridiales bacterium]|nr:InlB B-repeat-containing protein [Clostridiales bacterium]